MSQPPENALILKTFSFMLTLTDLFLIGQNYYFPFNELENPMETEQTFNVPPQILFLFSFLGIDSL